jgi:outer membrane receptor protein involved in Fe transport
MSHKLKIQLFAGVASLAMVAPGFAQDDAVSDGGDGATTRDEIIVTSRFREESVQDIGASVTGLSSDDIREQGIRDFEDIARLVAGVQNIKGRQNSNNIAIRGVINAGIGDRSTSSVYSVFLDDVSVAAPGSQRDYSAVDLDRIEIIRGPQPTLFGEGAVGGVIRYFTQDPDLDGPMITGVAGGQFEKINDGGLAYSGQNATSLILSPGTLGLRVSGFYRKDEGFIDNPSEGEDVNDFDSIGGRAVLLAQPTDALEIRLSAFLSRDEMGESTQIDPGSDPEDLTFSVSPMSGDFDDDFDLYAGRISYDFGAFNFTSITGYYDRSTASSLFSAGNTFGLDPFFESDVMGSDIDTTSFITASTDQEQWSQEFRLVSNFDGPLNFTSGLYFRDKEITTIASLECVGCAAVTTPSSTNLANEINTVDSVQYSGFLELTYEVTDRLRLIGGLRYVNDKVTAVLVENEVINLVPRFDMGGNIIPWTESDPINFVSPLDILVGAGFGTEFEFKLDKVLPRGGLEYDVSDNVLFYASASTGARNGGIGQGIGALSNSGGDPDLFFEQIQYQEDSVLSIEGGLKTQLMDGALTANIGAFHTKYKDTQILVQLPASNNTNGPDQRIMGIEIETAYRFNEDLLTFFNAAVMDAEFTDGFSSVLAPPPGEMAPFIDILDGNSPTDAPTLSFSTGYSYSRPIGPNGLRLTSNGTFQFIGERESSVQNYPSTRLDSLSNLNLRLGVENDTWALTAFVTNLLNDIEEVNIGANSLAHFINASGVLDANPTSASVNRPRSYGVSLTVRY